MCGRFTLRHPRRVRSWGVPSADLFELLPRFNIAPGQKIWALTAAGSNVELKQFDWGLVPSWSKEAAGLINARAETLEEKPSFSDSFQTRRCLIPADGFYEWKRRGQTGSPTFQLQDESLFAFAGIWDQWSAGDTRSSPRDHYTIANDLLGPIHDRMPVILQPESHDLWLDARTPAAELKRVLNPFRKRDEELSGRQRRQPRSHRCRSSGATCGRAT